MERRDFLCLAGSFAAEPTLRKVADALPGMNASLSFPIVDSHVHLFDPTRPGGVPWPDKDDTALYRPALPDRYEAMASPFGIVGCIAVEASPLPSDNDWLLGVAHDHPLVLGIVGDLVPGTPRFSSELDRLHKNPLFLGIRYGNLWNRNLGNDLAKPRFIDDLRALSQAGLVFESANPDAPLIRALLQVADIVSTLQIVVDHLPNAVTPNQAAAQKEYYDNLHALAQHSNIVAKLSEIPVVRNGSLIRDPAFYRDRLDGLWDLFGEDRVVFGSDWPNSDHVAPFADTLGVVRQYMAQKSQSAREKYFWRNSARVYRWQPRRPDQPRL